MFDNSQTKGTISAKLVFFYVILAFDLFSGSMVETHFDKNSVEYGQGIAIPILIIQMVIVLLLILSFFILLWQVFPLRQAMIGELCKVFQSHIALSLLYLALSIGERIYRLIAIIQDDDNLDIEIWKNMVYQILYYAKYAVQPFAYGKLIDGTMKLSLPEFYKPNKWIR